jgi:hypothetical protein
VISDSKLRLCRLAVLFPPNLPPRLTLFIRLSVDIFFVSDSQDSFIKLWNLTFESYMEFSGLVVRLRLELLCSEKTIAPLYKA